MKDINITISNDMKKIIRARILLQEFVNEVSDILLDKFGQEVHYFHFSKFSESGVDAVKDYLDELMMDKFRGDISKLETNDETLKEYQI